MKVHTKKRFIVLVISLIVLMLAGCGGQLLQLGILKNEINDDVKVAVDRKTGQVTEVMPGADLQRAVAGLKDGGQILIKAGTYDIKDTILISGLKDITIKGMGEVWINTKGIDHQVITIRDCSNITIENLKAQHVIKEEADNRHLEDGRIGSVAGVYGSGKVSFVKCELIGCGIYGIYGEDTDEINIQECYIHHNSLKALAFSSMKKTLNVRIRDCRIVNNADFLQKEGNVNIIPEGTNTIMDNTPEAYGKKQVRAD